jgi:NIMA (never in mitosis gene a)-related kinase 1/4/5
VSNHCKQHGLMVSGLTFGPQKPSFRSIKVLGQGSFGKAVLVEEITTKVRCVVKQIALGKLSAKEQRETQQEACILSTLKFPNIVSYIDSYVRPTARGSFLYIVMEFADGGDLYTLIRSRRGSPLPEGTILDMFVQICLALKHIHDRKLIHRDLKTQNCFLTSSLIVKLGDFGVARVLRGTVQMAATKIGTPLTMVCNSPLLPRAIQQVS